MNPNPTTNQWIFSVLTPLLSIVLLIMGCTNTTPTSINNNPTGVADPIASTQAETRISDPFPDELQPLSDNELPQLTVRAGTTPVPVLQSSYCWTNGCRDFVGPPMVLDDYKFAIVKPNTTIKLFLPYTPAPTTIDLRQYKYTDAQTRSQGTSITIKPSSNSSPAELTSNDGSLKVPTESGKYYYDLSVSWMSADGKYSEGQTSFIFGFQVK